MNESWEIQENVADLRFYRLEIVESVIPVSCTSLIGFITRENEKKTCRSQNAIRNKGLGP